MSTGNLVGSAVMFSVQALFFILFGFYLFYRKNSTYGGRIRLYNGLRMHRLSSPEDFSRYAPIMNSQQLQDYVNPQIAQPASML